MSVGYVESRIDTADCVANVISLPDVEGGKAEAALDPYRFATRWIVAGFDSLKSTALNTSSS